MSMVYHFIVCIPVLLWMLVFFKLCVHSLWNLSMNQCKICVVVVLVDDHMLFFLSFHFA